MSDPTANPNSSDNSPSSDRADQSPTALAEQAATAAETAPGAAPPASAAAAAGAGAAPPASNTAPPAEVAGEGEASKPSERIRIGTQRPAAAPAAEGGVNPPAAPLAPKPVTPVTVADPAPKPPSNYPPPNVRDALSPELEAELEAALEGQSLDTLIEQTASDAGEELAPETQVKGRVSTRHADYLFVDLGGHRQGAVPLKQFGDNSPPEPDAEIDVQVVRLNTEEGLYELSLPNAATHVGNWDEIELGKVIEVAVTGVNKGGLECEAAGIRGFMPMGQISTYRVEKPEDYVGQRIAAVVTEANRERRNLVLSHRAVMERERAAKREQLLAELAPGQVREGIVRSLRDFGAFVDLGGVDGLIHVSKMSWDRVNHPSEVLSEGQTVKVKIERIDAETGKIGLSYRESAENPWEGVESKFPVGSRVTAAVSKTMDFGAFVKLAPGVEGLIHISELAHGRVHRTTDAVSEGQQVEVKILSVDREKQRISLSLKALMAAPEKADADKEEEKLFALPPDAPKAPKKQKGELKGGTGNPTGGEQFGLKW